MSLRFQVLAPIVLVLAASLVFAYLMGDNAKQKSVEIQDIVARSLQAQSHASKARMEFSALQTKVVGILDMTTFVSHDDVAGAFKQGDSAVLATMEELSGTALSAEVTAEIAALQDAYAAWRASMRIALGLDSADQIPTKEKLGRAELKVTSEFETVNSLVADTANQLTTVANADLSADLQNGLMTLAIGAAVCLFVALLIAHGITRPLIRITDAMSGLARGEHNISLPKSRWTREIRDMLAAVNVFRENAIERDRLSQESEQTQIERRRRASAMDKIFGQLNEMIEATVAGDFSKRVANDFDDEELRRLATMTNSLVDTVDHNIAETSRIMVALADGDLTGRLDPNAGGAFGQLNNAVNSTLEKLKELVGSIQTASETIQGVTDQLGSDSNQLSARSQQQAASVEETAAALVEMQSASSNVAHKASEARSMASQTRERTEKSLAVVTEAVAAMSRIEEASAEIGSILEIIEQISFQTNLLALNAGVEAARAGEAGSGFAVVAQEVRDLAQRSASSAHEIKQLIDRTRGEISNGVGLVKSTGGSLGELQEKMVMIDENITSIASAITEQSQGIDSVNSSVSQIDGLTQQNTNMVIETTNAVDVMANEVSRLSHLLSQFRADSTAPRVENRTAIAA